MINKRQNKARTKVTVSKAPKKIAHVTVDQLVSLDYDLGHLTSPTSMQKTALEPEKHSA